MLKARKLYAEDPQKSIDASMRWFRKNRERGLETNRKWRMGLRRQVLEHYGGKPPKCACCEESEYEFLTVDHLNNDGTKERREAGTGGHHSYRFIIRNNFPEKYQILCYNCNCGRGKLNQNFICPHKMEKVETLTS